MNMQVVMDLVRKQEQNFFGEVNGKLASREQVASIGETWTTGDILNASIGQGGNSFTPIQMAKYVSILARGGKQVTPTIVKTIINADGTEVSRDEIRQNINARLGIAEKARDNIEISDENLEAIMKGMKGVTSESGGTAYAVFRNFSIPVGRKDRFSAG